MISQKCLNGQHNGQLILILILENNLKSYYLVTKIISKQYPSLNFNDNLIHQLQIQKYFVLFLDPEFKFSETYPLPLK